MSEKQKERAGFVVIAGRPNAGKSTLMNYVLGSKISIVTAKAQTTRERVLGILTSPEGQIVFTDTPGIHRAKDGGINAYMMEEARRSFDGASCVWYIVDPGSKLEHEEAVIDVLKSTRVPVILLINKSDLKNWKPDLLEEGIIKRINENGIPFKKSFRISAERGTQVQDLLNETWAMLPHSPAYYPDPDQLSDKPTRFFVAEMVREQLLLQLGDEVPYSCAVEIERFDENVKPPRIEAIIHVERDSQKGMVIGAGGAKIKAIGVAARFEIEQFLGTNVFLGLKVKVLKDWSRDQDLLKRLGYNLPEKRSKERQSQAQAKGKKKDFK